MANRRRETEAEKAKREREERIELLKMKQGIIEDSELIPENEHIESEKPHGWGKFTNFLYHNKMFIIMGAFFVFVISVLVVQVVTREREDLYILAVSFDKESELGLRVDDLELALERYCPDFDENGNVHVLINYIDRTHEGTASQYDSGQAQKLSIEFMSAEAQLIVADEEYIEWLGSDTYADPNEYKRLFLDQSDLCSEDMLYKGVGIRLNKTPLAKEMEWEDCPDNVIILIRGEINTGAGTVKEHAKNREKAMTVLRNILDNKLENPELGNE